jgi:hypothetical protein
LAVQLLFVVATHPPPSASFNRSASIGPVIPVGLVLHKISLENIDIFVLQI